MSIAPTEIEQVFLEEFQEDNEEHHGVCPICYPKDRRPQISICGVDVTGEIFMPREELINICEACNKEGHRHMLQHLLRGDT